MKFKDEMTDGVVIFHVKGKIINTEDGTEFFGRLHEHLNRNAKNIVINMSRVEWLTSQGLGIFIRARDAVEKSHGRLALAKVEGKAAQLMIITRLTSTFEHYDSTEEALNALKN